MRWLTVCLLAVRLFAADEVLTESGVVSGMHGVNSEIRVFKGIPYAAAPVGDLRWRAPQTPVKWEGVRKGDRFSTACMHPFSRQHLGRGCRVRRFRPPRKVKILERAESMGDVTTRRTAARKTLHVDCGPCNVVLLPFWNAFPG